MRATVRVLSRLVSRSRCSDDAVKAFTALSTWNTAFSTCPKDSDSRSVCLRVNSALTHLSHGLPSPAVIMNNNSGSVLCFKLTGVIGAKSWMVILRAMIAHHAPPVGASTRKLCKCQSVVCACNWVGQTRHATINPYAHRPHRSLAHHGARQTYPSHRSPARRDEETRTSTEEPAQCCGNRAGSATSTWSEGTT